MSIYVYMQVSPVPLGSFAGGSFGAHLTCIYTYMDMDICIIYIYHPGAHLDGLVHYEKHGYKTRRQPAGDLPLVD